jgi:fructan beta-fructosidase
MRFVAAERYLHLPVKNGAAKVVFQLRDEGQLRREFEVELGTDVALDWWAGCDLGAFLGQDLELTVSGGDDDAAATVEAHLPEWLRLSPEPPGQDGLYHEAGRPQFHFTAQRGWNNDPNGLLYLHGEWHLFFQHNPFGTNWGNMHWGHAVSRDLVHWRELPTALYPRSLKDMAFSGGGLVDHGNSAGFGAGREDVPMVAFTSTGRGECLAYSPDGGTAWVEYGGNPILRHQGRDPRILWYAPGRKWVMVVYDEPENAWRYAFYESTDLRSWRFMTAMDGFYECPDLFELPLDGDPTRRRWILYGAERREANGRRHVARSSYRVGSFDGRTFTPETPMLIGHLGPNFYAAQSFANAPDGRVIMLGWLQGAAYPGMPFSQGLTVPLEVGLRNTAQGPRLTFLPVPELATLRRQTVTLDTPSLAAANTALHGTDAELLDLELELALTRESVVVVAVRGTAFSYDAAVETLTAPGVSVPLSLRDGQLDLRILVDRGVVEVFAGGGLVALSYGGGPAKPATPLRLELRGPGRVRRLTLSELTSVWPEQAPAPD